MKFKLHYCNRSFAGTRQHISIHSHLEISNFMLFKYSHSHIIIKIASCLLSVVGQKFIVFLRNFLRQKQTDTQEHQVVAIRPLPCKIIQTIIQISSKWGAVQESTLYQVKHSELVFRTIKYEHEV